jgi:hypothetical protein
LGINAHAESGASNRTHFTDQCHPNIADHYRKNAKNKPEPATAYFDLRWKPEIGVLKRDLMAPGGLQAQIRIMPAAPA